MSLSRTVLWIDHHQAQLMSFSAEQSEVRHLRAHTHSTRQHGSGVRTEHEFFGEVCDALTGEVLVTGSHQGQADFRHYVDKHRPAVAPRIVGWQTVDHPSQAQLLAQARRFFVERETLASGASGTTA